MIDLVECAEEHRWQIHEWRNLPEVRRYMYTTDEIPREVHDRWYDSLLAAEDRQGWVIRLDGQPVGAAFMTGIDRANAITVSTFKGPQYFAFHDALQNAVTRVFDGIEDKETAWGTWVTEVSSF